MGLGYLAQEKTSVSASYRSKKYFGDFGALPLSREEVQRADQLLRSWGIRHLSNQTANVAFRREKRRLEITRALATNPAFIILDEPFAGLTAGSSRHQSHHWPPQTARDRNIDFDHQCAGNVGMCATSLHFGRRSGDRIRPTGVHRCSEEVVAPIWEMTSGSDMALELRQQTETHPQLIMTPQLQMAIKLPAALAPGADGYIRRELEENPALEEVARPVRGRTLSESFEAVEPPPPSCRPARSSPVKARCGGVRLERLLG